MSEAPEIRRRQMSPEGSARRAERQLMIPIRERIAKLQSRVAFMAASSANGKSVDQESLVAGYRTARDEVLAIQAEIDSSLSGPSLGPADDCRRALRVLEQRLPS